MYTPGQLSPGLSQGWYLNREQPALCSGNATAVTFYSYSLLTVRSSYCIRWALFEPTAMRNRYTKV